MGRRSRRRRTARPRWLRRLRWLRLPRWVGRLRRSKPVRVAAITTAALAAVAALVATYLVSARSSWDDILPLAERHARATGLDPALVLAVIEAESKGRPKAVSRVGARGLMQLMPRTAAEVAGRAGIPYRGPDDLFDPDLNVRLGTLYLAQLRRQFADEPYLYLAAYNAGPGNVDKWRLQHPKLSAPELIEQVAFAETRAYVRRVLRLWKGRR